MKRLCLLFLTMWWIAFPGHANNVRIEGDIKVTDADVELYTGIATVKFKILWDNSWRDAFNYDGVYFFMKYKVDGDSEVWHHAYLMSEGHKINSRGYEMELSNSSGTKDRCEGFFLYRSDKSYGDSEVEVELKWLITSNTDRVLERDLFAGGKVFVSAMAMEMVHIPRGAFRIGDTQSKETFRKKDIFLPEEWDILKDDGTFEYASSDQPLKSTTKTPIRTANPPEFAVNRMNDPASGTTNAWVGVAKENGAEYWSVRFDKARKIRTLAIEGVSGMVPESWRFQAKNVSEQQWKNLDIDGSVEGRADQWRAGSVRTYPCSHCLTINTNDVAYEEYRIQILDNKAVAIKNVAMSEAKWVDSVDNSVLIYEPTTLLGGQRNLYADDTDTWDGTVPVTYPNGYPSFWVMKYEISQEQYVAFLNKLTAPQQRVRAGSELIKLVEGDYIFGPANRTEADRKKPSARNGIKLASISVNEEPYVFANDLNPVDEYAQDGDGQTLACNFLNAGDMLAYADWCGLRPLTEMEFEKMARRPYPAESVRREYAWNRADGFNATTAITPGTAGKKSEKPSNGNVNAAKALADNLGPVRSGAYAVGNQGNIAAGASFWGVMELSGNLSELYYNVNTEGRLFKGSANNNHGNGKIAENGVTDIVNTIWPTTSNAFSARGGNYLSAKEEVTISDRTQHWGLYANYTDLNEKRDSTTTFRLGRTTKVLTMNGEVILQNGLSSADAAPVDTVCNGSDYRINGAVPAEIEGAYQIAWMLSCDNGKTWDLIEGAEEPYLELTNLRSMNNATNYFREYQYKRYIFSNEEDVLQTRPVTIRVVDNYIAFDRMHDTIDIYERSHGVRVTAKQNTEFEWYWLPENSTKRQLTPEYILTENIQHLNFWKYSDFNYGAQAAGEQKVEVVTHVMGQCRQSDTLYVYVVPKPIEVVNLVNDGEVNSAFKCGNILIDNSNEEAHSYKTIQIGNRCWFAENMKKNIGTNMCPDNVTANCAIYGRLYVWRTAVGTMSTGVVQGVCPKGWHIPSNDEWTQLGTDAGGAKALKSQFNEWTYNASYLGTNTSGFGALPAGVKTYNRNTGYFTTPNSFHSINTTTMWWSSTFVNQNWGRNGSNSMLTANIPYYITFTNANAFSHGTGYFYSNVSYGAYYSYNNDVNYFYDNFYFSVRCIQDGTIPDTTE